MLNIGNYARFIVFMCICLHFVWSIALPYDPDDKKIQSVIPKEGIFEAFYPREMYGIPNSASRAPHSHGSFFKFRHPGLIESKNSAAYGKLDESVGTDQNNSMKIFPFQDTVLTDIVVLILIDAIPKYRSKS